jgi:hypothetical protein
MVVNSTAQFVKKWNFQSRVKMVKDVNVRNMVKKSCHLGGKDELHLTLQ